MAGCSTRGLGLRWKWACDRLRVRIEVRRRVLPPKSTAGPRRSNWYSACIIERRTAMEAARDDGRQNSRCPCHRSGVGASSAGQEPDLSLEGQGDAGGHVDAAAGAASHHHCVRAAIRGAGSEPYGSDRHRHAQSNPSLQAGRDRNRPWRAAARQRRPRAREGQMTESRHMQANASALHPDVVAVLDGLDISDRPINHPAGARVLPKEAYMSAAFHEFEKEAVFMHSWLCVGRVQQIPKPGDYVAITLLGEALLIVRGNDGEVRAMSAFCRHRGHRLAGYCW